MSSSNKISLSDLNKPNKQSTKSKRSLKVKNPFKKQKGPARDSKGKFTAGSGGLLSSKKLNIGRMLPAVLVIALVGGILVFRSFAATSKPPAYQYSITTCTNSNKLPAAEKLTDTQKKCIDESAEAASYRMALALVGKENDWSYKTYTQKLAGDRTVMADVVKSFANVSTVKFATMSDKEYVDKIAGLASATTRAQWTKDIANKKLTRDKLAENIATLFKTSKNKVQLSTYRLNNQQFMQNIYTNLLGSKANIAPNNWWVQQLDSEKWTRERVVQHIIGLDDAKNASRTKLITYANTKPKVSITQTAKAKQAAREKQLKANAASAKSQYEKSVKHHTDAVANNVKTLTTLANKTAPNANDLQTATNLNAQTASHAKQAMATRNKIKTLVSDSAKIYGAAAKLSKHATDISAAGAETQMKSIYSYNNKAINATNKANQQVNTAASKLAAVKSKYQAEQARQAAEKMPSQGVESGSTVGIESGGGEDGSTGGGSTGGGSCAGMTIAACESKIKSEKDANCKTTKGYDYVYDNSKRTCVQLPSFVEPRQNCQSGYTAASGSVRVSITIGLLSKTLYATAMNCKKNTTDITGGGFNRTKAYNLCSSPYVAKKIDKSFTTTLSKTAPDGWVCYISGGPTFR